MKLRLSPSVLSADFVKLEEQMDIIVSEGINTIHYDMMDGDYVPAMSFGPQVLKSIAKHYPGMYKDAHMMITEPDRFIDDVRAAGADIITVHPEACRHIHRAISHIKASGAKAGIAINPGTPLVMLEELLSEVDMVLIMSVNPGFGGQKFIPFSLDKIRRLAQMRQEKGLDFSIQVDGGISVANIEEVIRAGADNFVAGTAVFGGDMTENIRKFKEIMNRNGGMV